MPEIIQLNLNGTKYCILKEEILSVEENQNIHQLPLAQKHIAGIVLIKNRVLTLADLCVCIGLHPITNYKGIQIFLISEPDDIAGFAVEDKCSYYSISDDEILSMPEYLKTPVIDKCIIHNGDPIPLINIKTLFNHVKQTGYKPHEFEYIARDRTNTGFDRLNDFRVIECGAETFALPAQGIEENLSDADHIVRLEMTPAYISGVMYCDMKLLPVIRLSSRMNLAEQGKGDRVLITDIDGGFGFQIDSRKETINKHAVVIYPLPSIVQSRWMKNAIVNNNIIIPVVEPGILVSSNFNRSDEPAMHERYKPDSQFFSQFGREDVEVIEFSLLGICHSLPYSEVEDTIDCRPYRNMPDVKQIVIGIAEHDEELLPVLDLAMCFGKRSPVTPLWKMILVSNGDFRAFIVTERLIGTQKIPVSMQRKLPITLPNRVVYGCYPDERTDAIRLILNVEALAVYFDEKLVREISEAFAGKLKGANIGIVPELIDTNKPEEAEPEYWETGEIGKETPEQSETVPGKAEKEELKKIEMAHEEPADSEVAVQKPEMAEDTGPIKSEKPDQNDISEPETEQVEILESIIVKEPGNTANITQTIEITQVTEDGKEDKDKKEEEPDNIANITQTIDIAQVTEDKKEAVDEKVKLEKTEENMVIEEKEELKQPALTQLHDYSTADFQKSSDNLRPGTDKSETEVVESHTKKYLFIAAIIIISLILVIVIFHNNIQIPDDGKLTTPSEETKSAEQTIKKKYPEETQKKKTAVINPGKEYKTQKPAAFSYEDREYEVKKGDTLYKITGSYTGNGFDYWEVAKENKIINPDLIFPGQKIRIKVKK